MRNQPLSTLQPTTHNLKPTTHNLKSTTKNTLLVALMLVSGFASAQTDKYTSAMNKGVTMLDSARDEQSFLAATNYFERGANAETKQWLPIYYVAYANLFSGLTSQDQSKKDAIFDKALEQVSKAEAMSANNSEIFTLKGFAQFMKMSLDPPSRLGLIWEVNAALAQAKAIEPKTLDRILLLLKTRFIRLKHLVVAKAKQNLC